MTTREEVLAYGLSFPNTYYNTPFRDTSWQLVRLQESGKVFLWIYERNGHVCINVKVEPELRWLWRDAYEAVQPGYHQNKEHWNTVILNGTVPREEIECMIGLSYDLVKLKKRKARK